MEIQKIFSNVEDPEENLYSVLMSEEEVALYSEMIETLYSEEEEDRGKNLRRAGNAALAAGTAAGAYGTHQAMKGLKILGDEIHTIARHKKMNRVNLTPSPHSLKNEIIKTKTTSPEAFERYKAMVDKKVAPMAKKSKIATGVTAAGLATGLGLKIAANIKKNKDNK